MCKTRLSNPHAHTHTAHFLFFFFHLFSFFEADTVHLSGQTPFVQPDFLTYPTRLHLSEQTFSFVRPDFLTYPTNFVSFIRPDFIIRPTGLVPSGSTHSRPPKTNSYHSVIDRARVNISCPYALAFVLFVFLFVCDRQRLLV